MVAFVFGIYNSRNYWSLLAFYVRHTYALIYNSRNYWSLLALQKLFYWEYASTIVEIIEAY